MYAFHIPTLTWQRKFICLQAHSSVEKAGLIGLVKMRFIESDDSLSLRGAQVMEAIATDKKQNLIPFFVSISVEW